MKSSSRALLAVILSGALTLTAACSDKPDKTDKGAPAASGAAGGSGDARADLNGAFKKLAGVPAAYTTSTVSGNNVSNKLTGSTDPAKKASTAKMTVTAAEQQINADVIVVGNDVYVKISREIPNVDAKKWMHVDGAKTSLSKLGLGNPVDPANVNGFADAIVTAERTGTGTYKGTFDLTKRPSPAYSAATLQQLGDAAKSVPFEATVNPDGYLAALSFKTPAVGRQVPPSTATTTFADFGKAVKISKPASSEVQPASAAFLSQFA